jgi:hypothetical protein
VGVTLVFGKTCLNRDVQGVEMPARKITTVTLGCQMLLRTMVVCRVIVLLVIAYLNINVQGPEMWTRE